MSFLEMNSKISRPLVHLSAMPTDVTLIGLLHVDLFIVADDGGCLRVGSRTCRALDTSVGQTTEEYRT